MNIAKNKLQICIIMPAYRSADTIETAIRSIKNCSVGLKIAVSVRKNDVATIEAVKKLEHPNVCIIEQSGTGISNARNTVLRTVTADFYLFLDSDDSIVGEILEFYARDIKHSTEVCLRYCDWIAQLPDGSERQKKVPFISNRHLSCSLLCIENFLATGGTLLDKRIVDDIGYFDETLSHGEDWEYWIRVHRRYAFKKAPLIGLKYRHTKLSQLRSRPFWMQEVDIIRRHNPSKFLRMFGIACAKGRYAIYFLLTFSARSHIEKLDYKVTDFLWIPFALSLKLFKRALSYL